MGCSESAPVMEKTVIKAPPLEVIKTVTKPKVEEAANFIFGHIAEEEYLFARVNLASHSFDILSIPQHFKPHNFSLMLAINNKEYLISGGIDFTLKDISTVCYIYNVPSHAVKQTAQMHQARYTHAGLFHQQQIFVFGGRYFGDDDVAILASCQVYSIVKDEWTVLPSMNFRRCTCYAMLWNDHVYVFGGYTGEFQRSEKIQCLNQKEGKWDILPFELNRGIESGFVVSSRQNEVTIFGGNTNSGPTASVITLNFEEQTVGSHRYLKEQKMLHKGFSKGQEMYLLGGSERGDLEVYNTKSNTTRTIDIKLNEQFSPEIFEGLSHSENSIIVQYEKLKENDAKVSEEDELVLTFGTTEEPFIFELNVSAPSTRVWSVPLNLKLYAEAGGVHLQGLEFMMFGGIEDDSLSTVTSDTYLYNHTTKSSTKLASMQTPRFSFAYQRIGNKVYVLGGGYSDPEGDLIILDRCQFFDINTQTWNSICNLPTSLMTSTALNCNSTLYLLGGIEQNKQRSKAIYKYSQSSDSWSQLSFHIPFGIEATSVYRYKSQEFYVFGGRIDNGDSCTIWDLVFKDEGESVECAFFEKGKMSQTKNSVKVFKPKDQTFLVVLGGASDMVSYFDIQTLKPMEWDGLRRLKQVFSTELGNLNSPKMKNYLTIAPSNHT